MRTRFIRTSLLAVVAALLAASVLSAFLVEREYTHEVKSRLDAVLAIAVGHVETERLLSDPDFGALSDALSSSLSAVDQDIRVTVIDTDGIVLGDSATDDLTELENHRLRPEVIAAVEGGRGYDVRSSTVVDTHYYYAARMAASHVLRVAMPMEHLVYIRWFLAGTAGVGALVGLAIAMIAVTALIRRITRPIESMTADALRYAGGDFQTRMHEAPDELGRLSEAFNQMADQLAYSYADLEESHDRLNSVLQGMDDGIIAMKPDGEIIILTDRLRDILGQPADGGNIRDAGPNYLLLRNIMRQAIDSHSPVREEIEFAHPEGNRLTVYATPLRQGTHEGALAVVADVTRIRKLEKIRSEFVSNVTHELKTPLTSIRGYVELLKDGQRDAETAAQFYEIIEIEAERLQALIDDLLNLSEIENGMMESSMPQPVCLSEIATDVVARLLPIAEKAGVEIRTELDLDLTLPASPLRMEQLFYNLIDNAIKYNKPGGSVTVAIRRERNFTVIDISDSGIGIPKKHQDRVFERFYRVDKSRSRQLGGTGLGLSIVKHIVSLYEGDIHLVSEPGEGSRFVIRFP